MIRRSLIVLSQRASGGGASASASGARRTPRTPSRTLVRDPRNKKRLPAVFKEENDLVEEPASRHPLAFEPSQQNTQSVGSSLISYGLAGVGVTFGVILVQLVLGF
jgi:hypothetical protein